MSSSRSCLDRLSTCFRSSATGTVLCILISILDVLPVILLAVFKKSRSMLIFSVRQSRRASRAVSSSPPASVLALVRLIRRIRSSCSARRASSSFRSAAGSSAGCSPLLHARVELQPLPELKQPFLQICPQNQGFRQFHLHTSSLPHPFFLIITQKPLPVEMQSRRQKDFTFSAAPASAGFPKSAGQSLRQPAAPQQPGEA